MDVYSRRFTKIDHIITAVDSSHNILFSDTGNDQTLVTSSWRVIPRIGRKNVIMTGAFAGLSEDEVFSVVSAIAKLIGVDGVPYAAVVNEALYNSNTAQYESLLSVHQSLRRMANGIDDRAKCEMDVNGQPGLQVARFGSMCIPSFFDGVKCFFEALPISEEELQQLPRIKLTDGTIPYEPLVRLNSRR